MKVVLTRSLWINNHIYPAGEQDISEEKLRDKQFAKHISAGHIVEASQAPRRTVIKTVKERAEGLLEKLHGKNLKDATPEQAAGAKGGVKSDGAGDADAEAKAKEEADAAKAADEAKAAEELKAAEEAAQQSNGKPRRNR